MLAIHAVSADSYSALGNAVFYVTLQENFMRHALKPCSKINVSLIFNSISAIHRFPY